MKHIKVMNILLPFSIIILYILVLLWSDIYIYIYIYIYKCNSVQCPKQVGPWHYCLETSPPCWQYQSAFISLLNWPSFLCLVKADIIVNFYKTWLQTWGKIWRVFGLRCQKLEKLHIEETQNSLFVKAY